MSIASYSIPVILLSLLTSFTLNNFFLKVECAKLSDDVGDAKSSTSVKDKTLKFQKKAVSAWSEMLIDADFDIKQWPIITKKEQPQHFFDSYAQKLSDVFKINNAKLNFVLVGACDGTHDMTIRLRFLPNSHWQAVFVEPISMNYNDLIKNLKNNSALDRSFPIKAAVTDKCETANVTLKVANFENKNPNAPHWLRREIGSILKSPDDKLSSDWSKETVPCKTAVDIMNDWTNAYYQKLPKTKLNRRKTPRIHILKIDAEGHDYEVLSSFLREDTPAEALPLMICFEAKSMKEKLHIAVDLMTKKGYVVSEGVTNDGFALLHSKYIVQPKGNKSSKKKKKEEASDLSGRNENSKKKRKNKNKINQQE